VDTGEVICSGSTILGETEEVYHEEGRKKRRDREVCVGVCVWVDMYERESERERERAREQECE
jgi:hypothetical protein